MPGRSAGHDDFLRRIEDVGGRDKSGNEEALSVENVRNLLHFLAFIDAPQLVLLHIA
jgi:hypothetical protein